MTDRLYVLAFDHRRSLMTSFFGVDGEPSADDVDRARLSKQVIWEGLLRAIEDGVPRAAAAALVDVTYGADVIAAAAARGIRVSVPVEASGRRELAFEHDDWRNRIDRLDPAWAKVLVRYRPDEEDPELNARQRHLLAELDAHCRATERGLMLELLVPPGPGEDVVAFDAALRPDLMVRAIEEIRADGIVPSVWKLEGLSSPADCERVARAAAAPCLVLGRGEDRGAVDAWLRAAAGLPGYAGFAIGRSIWWDALRRFFDEEATRAEAAAAIASEYARYLEVYEAAAG
jgi:myo-inositol catabolism protein IolC